MGIASRLAVFEYGHVYLSVCVCQSQVGVLTKRMGGSRWFLARRLFLRPIMHCNKLLKGNSDHYKRRTLFSGTLSQTPDLFAGRHGASFVAKCCQLSSTKVESGRFARDKLHSTTVVGRSWQYLLRSTVSLSHRASISVYSTVRVRPHVARVRLRHLVLVTLYCVQELAYSTVGAYTERGAYETKKTRRQRLHNRGAVKRTGRMWSIV